MLADSEVTADLPDERVATKRVAILMGTKNGAVFLGEQLQSIASQTHRNWTLFVSDDGSTDTTTDLVKRFAHENPHKVTLRDGPRKGVRENFLALAIDSSVHADYFAFSDQDDIWYPNKLRRALDWLCGVSEDVPALYCGRTELVRADGTPYGLSPRFARPPAFENALVQSLGGGNTMVFNKATKRLLERAGPVEIVLHDWWLYQLVSAAGGSIHYDARPTLKYRQHSDNVIGTNRGRSARLLRLRMLLNGRFRRWNDINIATLQKIPQDVFAAKNRTTLQHFAEARTGGVLKRLKHLKQSGVYRQTTLGNLGLFFGTILKRV